MNTIDALSILETSLSGEDSRIALEYLVDSKVYNDLIIDYFSKGLSSDDSGIKDISARGLSEAPPSFRAVSAHIVAPMIMSGNVELRNLAADILTKLGTFACESIYPYLTHPSSDVKKFACDILGQIGDENTLDEIYGLLNDKDLNVKNSCIESIGNICSRLHDSGMDYKIPISRLVLLFDQFEDTRPLIIETIGKIGGYEAESFLISKISSEEDLFIQTLLIDSISYTVNNPDIARSLLSLIPISPLALQKIILKAVFAISFRTGVEIEIGSDIREIAYKALQDDDPEIQTAGLLALGKIYSENDIPYILNQIYNSNQEIVQFVLDNLLNYSSLEIIEKFFIQFNEKWKADGDFSKALELLGNLNLVWDDIPYKNKLSAMKALVSSSSDFETGYENELIEMLAEIDLPALQDVVGMKNDITK